MDQTEDKLSKIGDFHTNADLAFEEFKNGVSLKTKVLQESSASHGQKIAVIENRVKDQHAYLLRLKARI